MPLKAVVADLNEVDEQYRGLYKEHEGGGFRLDAEGIEFKEDVEGLKNALSTERTQRKELEKKIKSLPTDFDPEKWKQLTQAEQKRIEDEAKKNGEWENLKKQIQESHAKEKEQWEKERSGYENTIDQLLRKNKAAEVVAAKKGNMKLLEPHILAKTKTVRNDDGDYTVIVIDEKGNRRIGKNGDDMTIDELVEEMRASDDFAAAFEGSGAAGGGAGGRGGAGGSGKGQIRSKADLKDVKAKVDFISEHGQDAYLNLPDK